MLTVNWNTNVITVPLTDLTLVSGTNYQLTVDFWWQLIRDKTDDVDAAPNSRLYNNIPPTSSTPRIVEVLAPYTVTFENGNYSVNIVGGNTNLRDVVNKNNVSVNTNNTTGFIDPVFLEAGLFNSIVTLDQVNGFAGTGKTASGGVIGTPSYPSNNITDALAIATARGFGTIYIVGTASLGASPSLAGWSFDGKNKAASKIVFTAANTDAASFKNLRVEGGMNGSIYAENCSIGAITGIGSTLINSVLHECLLEGDITLLAGNTRRFNFVNCSTATDALISVNVNGSTGHISLLGHQCRIQFRNVTQPIDIHISGRGMELFLDASVTSGAWEVHGDVSYTDNSTSWVSFDYDDIPNLSARATRLELAPEMLQITQGSKILRNKVVTDPIAGTLTVYDDDGITILFVAPLWENVAGTQGYRGQGISRRDRLA